MNQELGNVFHWANDWLVSFSHKTKSLIISNKANVEDHPDLLIAGHIIERVDHHKHLGWTS